MPELPEVETVRRDLEPLVRNQRITAFRVEPGGERLLLGVPAEALAAQLVGRRITGVGRRGKYLVFQLDNGRCWVVHLRMTGSLRYRGKKAPADPFLRATVSLNNGHELRFTDIRKFGTFVVADRPELATPAFGPEPLTPGFTAEALWEGLRGRNMPLKSTLLNQEIVAGIGNIYADEALFLARLHPLVPAGALRPQERRALHAALEQTIREGIEHRGASFRDYTDAKGEYGDQQHFVRVFRRTDQPCDVCGSPIRRTVVGGRATHWCPTCQPARQAHRLVRSRRPKRVSDASAMRDDVASRGEQGTPRRRVRA